MTLIGIDQLVRELGPQWTWLVRSVDPAEEKPGKYLANLIFDKTGPSPAYFPVFADTPIAAFNEAYRRASLFAKEGVR